MVNVIKQDENNNDSKNKDKNLAKFKKYTFLNILGKDKKNLQTILEQFLNRDLKSMFLEYCSYNILPLNGVKLYLYLIRERAVFIICAVSKSNVHINMTITLILI
jgi:hypothetical protein